ncbi:MAG: FMN-binding protein [Microbacteriaceae bacterium]
MKNSTRKNAVATLAALTLLGSVTGCATTANGDVGPTSPGTGTSSDAPYADGEYSAKGTYQSPHGTEAVDVTLTLKGDIVTALTVVGEGDNPDSKRYQGEFIGGVKSEVVGKNIDELSVDRVAGSSLTSGGFNDAIEQIKADALG